MILLIDNYDSFTYNLYDYLQQLHNDVRVYRNDEITIEQIEALNPQAIVISPGPKTPEDAGITMQIIQHFYTTKPILGICLGHQALGMFFGASLVKLQYPMHGKTSAVYYEEDDIFKNIPNPFQAMRYHSLHIENSNQSDIKVIATVEDGTIMAIKHQQYPLYGLQFHPESILTEEGLSILKNWVSAL